MIQMNLFMKHSQTPAQRDLQLPSGMRLGEGKIGNLGLADISCYIQDGSTMRFYRIAENDDKP